jgi:hypothetical protein
MGVKNVYVKVDDKSKFEAYLENNLGTILEDDKIEIEERSKIFYNVSGIYLKIH